MDSNNTANTNNQPPADESNIDRLSQDLENIIEKAKLENPQKVQTDADNHSVLANDMTVPDSKEIDYEPKDQPQVVMQENPPVPKQDTNIRLDKPEQVSVPAQEALQKVSDTQSQATPISDVKEVEPSMAGEQTGGKGSKVVLWIAVATFIVSLLGLGAYFIGSMKLGEAGTKATATPEVLETPITEATPYETPEETATPSSQLSSPSPSASASASPSSSATPSSTPKSQ